MRAIVTLFVLLLTFVRQPVVVRVGQTGDEAFLPTGHHARGAGEFLQFAGRPVDAVASLDGRRLYVKDRGSVRVVDVPTWTLKSELPLKGGASLAGIALSPDGSQLAVTNADRSVAIYSVTGDIALTKTLDIEPLKQGSKPYPIGVMYAPDGNSLYLALSMENRVAEVNVADGKTLRSVDVGVAPYGLAATNGRLFVTEMGGPRAKPGDLTSPSAGTPTVVDKRGVAKSGSVSVIDIATFKVLKQVVCGRQPSAIVADSHRGRVYVAETNDDGVLVLDGVGSVVTRIDVKPDTGLPFGSMPDALSLSRDGGRLVVALAGNNAVAVYRTAGKPKLEGLAPTDWYPMAAVATDKNLLVVNNKGLGARIRTRDPKGGWNSGDEEGTLRKLSWNDFSSHQADLAKQTVADAETAKIQEAVAVAPRSDAKPVPIPERVGEPSVLKHVVYVLKENRTYDQILGDIGKGDSDPALCTFGRQVTPNQHKIAEEFVLLDNYYCNGVLSADGHSWATEGNLAPYLNRAFGGFTRSYTFGDDPITYSSSGFVWDAVIASGRQFRNYGEFHYTEPVEKLDGKQIWDKYKAGERIPWKHEVGVESMKRLANKDYPGWNLNIPDQLRMDVFLKDFEEYKAKGSMPDFILLYLPQDHTGGAVSPRSNVADNDLAVGRLIDALSHSQFWKDTVVFINEDDPQAGFDHIDGHRSMCLVASPYTRGGKVDSDFFNQSSVLHTIHQIFGLPPMNQMDAASPLMSSCFHDDPDMTPFVAEKNRVPLDEFPKKPLAHATAYEKAILARVARIDLRKHEVQTPADMDTMNRYAWGSTRGWSTPYPADFAGAHGRGLASRGLKLADGAGVEDDDDD